MSSFFTHHAHIASIEDLLYQGKEAAKDRFAYTWIEGGKVVGKTYTELYQDAASVARFLEAEKLLNKSLAVLGPYGYDYMVLILGALCAGAVIAPLDRLLDGSEVRCQLSLGAVDVLLVHPDYLQKLEAMDSVRLIPFAQAMEDRGPILRLERSVDTSKLALMLFTSGTTGRFKVCQISQDNLLFNVYKGFEVLGPLEGHQMLSILPMHHVAEFVAGQLGPLSNHLTIAINGSLHQLPTSLSTFAPSVMMVVPRVLEAFKGRILKVVEGSKLKILAFNLLRYLGRFLCFFGIDIRRRLFSKVIDALGGRLCLVLSGAAALDMKTERFFEDLGIEVISTYGMTECAPLIASNTRKKKKRGSVGQVAQGVELKVVHGQFYVRGPNVMLGYKDPQMQAQAFEDGWFKTKDLGHMDEDGYLFLTGRVDSQIKLGNGEKVSPEELEAFYERIDAVQEVMVHGQGDRLVLQVFGEHLTEEKQSALLKAVKAINKGLPLYKRVSEIFVRKTAFLKTKTLKILRNEANENTDEAIRLKKEG